MSSNLRQRFCWVLLEVRLPQSNDIPAASPEVSVLRLIQCDTAPDARFGGLIPAVPVVTVELHGELNRGDQGIWSELPAERFLSQIRHPQLVKQGIPGYFAGGHLASAPHRAAFNDTCAICGVGVPTRKRAVLIRALAAEAWRETEVSMTDRARVVSLVSPLPGVVTCGRAEPGSREARSAAGGIEVGMTDGATTEGASATRFIEAGSTTPPFSDVGIAIAGDSAGLTGESVTEGDALALHGAELSSGGTARAGIGVELGIADWTGLKDAPTSVRSGSPGGVVAGAGAVVSLTDVAGLAVDRYSALSTGDEHA